MIPKFFVAVDGGDYCNTYNKLEKISAVGGDYGIKLNLDNILTNASIIEYVVKKTQRFLFVDLKMWNGSRTMSEVVKHLALWGANMVNMYALADDMLEAPVAIAKKAGLTVLGVTVLTHYTEAYCQKFYKMTMNELVRLLAETALSRGCDGYILPGNSLDAVRDLGGEKFNPAVRPAWFNDKKTNLQEQIMAPGEAIKKGATIVSCGSPIFESPDPAGALRLILDEIVAVH
ncbi:hypothetical protein A2Y83_02115 [Candidatus Falkowbacteria bacterium RBG_13_39_14]|uniref:Orotidine 5'-phosphate decarboxylase n=1 Tax=Candidatus Falkowbacteria bacterium RBG_13_39_14 TaxID=1797985 RepID=A0A1F5S893_9BACT|nr:MAG: hypothetical protein A2Y83_02115 [Candidatus Falkowbacteria bacterium RBG_13_39_14]